MLKFFNANQKIFKKIGYCFECKKLQQKINLYGKKILYDVRKEGDKAVIKYEKKFSK